MTEAEILQRLRPGAWISKAERKALEGVLAHMRAGKGVQPAAISALSANPVSAPASANYGHIRIVGSPAFIRASKAALDILKTIPSWKWVIHLKALKEAQDTISSRPGSIHGYYDRPSETFVVFPPSWSRRAKDYAADILHEAAHAAHPPTGDPTEDERIAMRIENEGRRQMGFWVTFAPEDDPTHHVQWAKDWVKAHGAQAGRLASMRGARGMVSEIKLDPASLAQLKREVEKIPPQSNPRAEANRLKLKSAVERMERESKRVANR